MAKIAVTHPGKIGDALYSLPTIKWLCHKHGCQADFYTSEYCRPMEPLLRQQPFIADFLVPKDYSPQRFDCGVQPWLMPISGAYEAVYQLGFRSLPDCRLVDWMATSVGAPIGLPVHYDCECRPTGLSRPYVVIAPRQPSDFSQAFRDICENCPVDVVQIGRAGEAIPGYGFDRTGEDLVTTANIIKGSLAFFGLMSSQLVLANGWQLPKIVAHNSEDLRQLETTPGNIYLRNPTGEQMLRCAGLGMTYSKCLELPDYSRTNDYQHIEGMRKVLSGIDYRFDHPHRCWEYGITLSAIRTTDARTLLDVGGSHSLLGPAAAWINAAVTVVDPEPCEASVALQSQRINKDIRYLRQQFSSDSVDGLYDAVTCLSVIEHVRDDVEFLIDLSRKVARGGLLCITTDFHPSGQPRFDSHLRTYNADGMNRLCAVLSERGFAIHGSGADYTRFSPHVNDYTFASLIVRREQ